MPERKVSPGFNWQVALESLRQALPREREVGGVRGSLRWLEHQMQLLGASPSVVRNIVYRDVGTQADKEKLYGLLSKLALEVGLSLPALPPAAAIPEELELLGRNKRRAFKQFLRTLQAGKVARMVLTGTKGVGKTLLLEHLERELQLLTPPIKVTRLTLEGDLTRIFGGFAGHGQQPFAVQAEQQAQAVQAYLAAVDGVLLVRVARQMNFSGLPLRQRDGAVVTPTTWVLQQLYVQAPEQLSVLLASEDESSVETFEGLSSGEHVRLTSPSRAEARSYLMARLNISAQQADELAQQTGRNLDRLTLLAIARGQGQADLSRLLQDPEAVELLCALRACQQLQEQPGATGSERLTDGPYSRTALETALGYPLNQLSPHVRALLDEVNGQWPRPVSALLLGEAPPLPPEKIQAAWQRLLGLARNVQHPLHLLLPDLLALLGRWEEVAQHGQNQQGAVAALWPQIRRLPASELQEELARQVVVFYALRGEYSHPQAREALSLLLEAGREVVSIWARVKLAESCVDTGRFEVAEQHLQLPALQALLARAATGDWEQRVQGDALLVAAALARWRGQLSQATALVSDPRTQHSGPRATLWRGLIAKDAGDWQAALQALQEVPEQYPLLHARARYQEGDLRLRLGQPEAARRLLEAAAEQLEHTAGSPEERSRIAGRLLTTYRRLGDLQAAQGYQQQLRNVMQNTDPVLGARLASEGLPLLLALCNPQQALEAARGALQLLQRPGTRQAEAGYRQRRTLYRLALCYLVRGTGQAYKQPFLGVMGAENADIAQAKALLDQLLTQPHSPLDRDQTLRFDLLLSRALAESQQQQALELAQQALAAAQQPYTEAQAHALRAEILVRGGQPEAALRDIHRAYTLWRRSGYSLGDSQQPDPGLHALLLTLEALCNLQLGEGRALEWFQAELQDHTLRHFRGQCWQAVGRFLEQHPERQALLEPLKLPEWAQQMRLADALALLHELPQDD